MNSGAYRLLIRINIDTTIKIGALGYHSFKKGIYIYTGSAMKNLKQRIERHNSKDKKLHWHIDYLLDNPNAKILKIEVYESETKNECDLNQQLINSNNTIIPVKGFGSSDCNICQAHLVMLKENKSSEDLRIKGNSKPWY
jgi:sugar fermentation stimulation protein A